MASVLVIDDDDQLRLFLRMVLEEEGHVVQEARNGAEGLRAYQGQPADLVLCDMVMDMKGGLSTIIDLRKQDPRVKIVAMSGGSLVPADFLCQAVRFGAAAALDKPLQREGLLATLNRVLRA